MSESSNEMSFLDHLEQLRWHLIRATLAIFIVAIVIFTFAEIVYDQFLFAHLDGDFPTYTLLCQGAQYIGIESDFCNMDLTNNMQSLGPTKQLMNLIWTSLILGLIVSFPYVLWEMWRFISPGLHKKEQKKSRMFMFYASVLFFIGVLFSYYVIAPLSVAFFYNFQISDLIENKFDFTTHITLITNTLLGVSLMFELPVLIFFLTKMGLVTPDFLKKYRKVALVLVLTLSAIITPPDIASQVIVTIPIMVLYEISILISKRVVKQESKALRNV
ncbi:MAG: twin arginine-targeting protein translocase TatC [Bacteroidetes bacterium MedPE-SWsnd-G1]|uniref:Sec-independent protein translocase protein TatC n=1 Tax=Urechidicola vernalis TaxID=3075600 RepID=A0ABU2Y217_9FLAO|nr:twin-arginine translocase subunit TatC [Urechidicola sp. P050]MDT0552249.1 twin-arginine translocase subunit TatC [Urechidicola sp. P050]OIQ36307.1 MAG: twin arginine-targeting protein translocase TatC [Bacteroidetes bacterium MedPE-SWsnd-G1]